MEIFINGACIVILLALLYDTVRKRPVQDRPVIWLNYTKGAPPPDLVKYIREKRVMDIGPDECDPEYTRDAQRICFDLGVYWQSGSREVKPDERFRLCTIGGVYCMSAQAYGLILKDPEIKKH